MFRNDRAARRAIQIASLQGLIGKPGKTNSASSIHQIWISERSWPNKHLQPSIPDGEDADKGSVKWFFWG
jgi:hypothetical protein